MTDRVAMIWDLAEVIGRRLAVSLFAPLLAALFLVIAAALIGWVVGDQRGYVAGTTIMAVFYATPIAWIVGPFALWFFDRFAVRDFRIFAGVGAVLGLWVVAFVILPGSGFADWVIAPAIAAAAIHGAGVGSAFWLLELAVRPR